MKKLLEVEKMIQLMIRATPDMIARLDDWRRVQPDIPGRAEAVRRLVELGLTAKPRGERGKGK
ncbi:MAG: hypothetical protein WBE80_10185 [Methylocella sp.]